MSVEPSTPRAPPRKYGGATVRKTARRRSQTPVPQPVETLPESQIQELKAAFSLLDQNQDGRVNANELKVMLDNLGIMFTDAMINALIVQASGADEGLISEEEFLSWMSTRMGVKDDIMDDLMAAFKVFDKDSNGYISKDELKQAMEMIGEKLSDQELDSMLEATDTDKDGRINYQEFVTVLL
ncbi:calcium-binding protein E63-1-like isoform X2 [Ornithodoros turicata]